MIIIKTILDLNQILIFTSFVVFFLIMIFKYKANRIGFDVIFNDKWLTFIIVILATNAISYFFLRDEYITNSTNELKRTLSKNDSLFFSNEKIYLDTNKIYPCNYSDRYVNDSVYTLVLSDNTVITLQKFRNDTTKYGIHIINQVGFFNHNPIAIFKTE